MGEKELVNFIILINLILFAFIIGMVLFISQFRKRKMIHDKEINAVKEEYEKEKLRVEISAQREAMKEIGKEIHDGVGQKLTLASIYLKRQSSDQDATAKGAVISEICELIDESLNELRHLSRTLVNSDKHHTKLHDLILLEAKRVKAINEIDVIFTQNEEFEISEDFKHNIYRVIQEFLQNSIKHAQCTEIKINFNHSEGKLIVLCSDNGVGFDMKQTPGAGIGLSNMQQRILEMNGTINLNSAKGQGTHLNFVVDM